MCIDIDISTIIIITIVNITTNKTQLINLKLTAIQCCSQAQSKIESPILYLNTKVKASFVAQNKWSNNVHIVDSAGKLPLRHVTTTERNSHRLSMTSQNSSVRRRKLSVGGS